MYSKNVDTPLRCRIPEILDQALVQRASEFKISKSQLVRKLLTSALLEPKSLPLIEDPIILAALKKYNLKPEDICSMEKYDNKIRFVTKIRHKVIIYRLPPKN